MDATHIDYRNGQPQAVVVPPETTRDVGITYVLALFLGLFGAHNFYVRRTSVAVTQLVLTLVVIGIPVVFVWVIVDLFLIPGWVRELNVRVLNSRYPVAIQPPSFPDAT
jgi:TM2 domain-containing membrane protein YozV